MPRSSARPGGRTPSPGAPLQPCPRIRSSLARSLSTCLTVASRKTCTTTSGVCLFGISRSSSTIRRSGARPGEDLGPTRRPSSRRSCRRSGSIVWHERSPDDVKLLKGLSGSRRSGIEKNSWAGNRTLRAGGTRGAPFPRSVGWRRASIIPRGGGERLLRGEILSIVQVSEREVGEPVRIQRLVERHRKLLAAWLQHVELVFVSLELVHQDR